MDTKLIELDQLSDGDYQNLQGVQRDQPDVKVSINSDAKAPAPSDEMKALIASSDDPITLQEQKALREGYSWDLVAVFKVGDENKKVKVPVDSPSGRRNRKFETKTQRQAYTWETATTIVALEKAGLHVLKYASIQEDEVYVLIGADEARLRKEAERLQYDLKLDPDEALRYGKALGLSLAKATGGPLVAMEAWRNIYAGYQWFDKPGQSEPDPRAKLYPHYNEGPHHPNTVFRSIDRIKLTNSIIDADTVLGGAGLKMRVGVSDESHPLVAYFPLDDKPKKTALTRKWAHWTALHRPPLDEIREYFGEQIAIYFAFLSFYSRWLLLPSLVGILFFLWQLGAKRIDVDGVAAFAVLMALWGTGMLEAWKRHQAALVSAWGMHNFLEKETPRPEFKGNWEISPVTGRYEESFPLFEKIKRAVISQTVIWTLIGVVIACVAGIFIFRGFLQRQDSKNGGIVAGVVNAVQIQILNAIYGMVSKTLNDYENHRTETEYENALIAKSFLFKFVNSYNSLFYIAFIKKWDTTLDVNTCADKPNCLDELQQQLGTIFVSSLVISNAVELITPIIKRALSRRKESTEKVGIRELLKDTSRSNRNKSPPEQQYEETPYESTFDDWDEIVIQYGFIVLFVVAFPIAPALALINNWFENKVDSKKLCLYFRRPLPKGAADIGMWYAILNTVSWVAVITNVAIVVFTTSQFTQYGSTTQWLIFVFSEHTILLMKAAIAFFVPDETQETKTQLQRQAYLANVLVGGMEERSENDVEIDEDILKGKKKPEEPPKDI